MRDAFISRKAAAPRRRCPPGAVVGTSSLRRQAQVKRLRPDLAVVPLRGNVETRLRKLDGRRRRCDAAGLRRPEAARPRRPHHRAGADRGDAARRGAGRHRRRDPRRRYAPWRELLAPINHQPTALAVTAERAFLAKLDGSCRTPIAGLAELAGGRLVFRGAILTPDGRQCHATRREGRPEEAIRLAEDAAAELLARAGPDFFRAV